MVVTTVPPACVTIVPLDNVAITLEGISLPDAAIVSRILFVPGDSASVAVISLVVPATDRARVVRDVLTAGATVTAMHRHLVGESPVLTVIHLTMRGDAAEIAATIRRVLGTPRRPRAPTITGPVGMISGVPCLRMAQALGVADGAVTRGPGYCEIVIEGDTTSRSIDGASARADLLLPSRVFLRQTTDRTTAILSASLTFPVPATATALATLVNAGLDVVARYSAVLAEQPALAVLHVQASGNPLLMVESLKAAADAARSVAADGHGSGVR